MATTIPGGAPAAPESANPAGQGPASTAAGSGKPEEAGGKIPLNTATMQQLMDLPGIGESKANAIIAYREQVGGQFHSVEQLLEVKGIGDKVLAKMKPYLTLDAKN
ncbi:helix-hairpin-helix domain-containing protein [Paenibacillus xerothermodurans]|uniref:Helix-hairpin-helix domain-containing protein n=2 Tax=Paenibacillus xerothermodurans TaxID=1977292 RepID=A0A2W1NYS6_PAEXE|nr:helix-hairpin-helix domain-containing protein [Paenibacillus xerothermodurans]